MARTREQKLAYLREYGKRPDLLEKRRAAQRSDYQKHKVARLAKNKKWRDNNKERLAALTLRWRKAHPERVRERNKAWWRAHPEQRRARDRARSARRWLDPKVREYHREADSIRAARVRSGGPAFTRAEWRALVASYLGRCVYCGMVAPLTADHLIPIVAGGTNDIENIVPACRPCNVRKNRNSLIVFMVKRAA